ncbi:hypothetical protein BKA61DRAFT_299216 [Leptodontidium sp. MPI-SDFR-AT-0119]|nr:hypothetical protein BKA61DRAFT_299216 [Leptodontidium sp. MPI-SDFR-AT-0119]
MDRILSLTTHALATCRGAYHVSQDAAALNATPSPIQSLSIQLQCLSETLSLVQAVKNVPGARLPSQMTEDLEALLGACATICEDAGAFVTKGVVTDGVAMSYGGMWRKFYVVLMALYTCQCAFQIAATSMNFATGAQYDIAQNRRAIVQFRGGISVQEKVIKGDAEASTALSIAFGKLPLRRYLYNAESLLNSDAPTAPAPTTPSDIPENHERTQNQSPTELVAAGIRRPESVEGDTQSSRSLAEIEKMGGLRSEMIYKVTDWKGLDPSTFGPLLLVKSFNGWYEVTSRADYSATMRNYRCYLFKEVFIACKVPILKKIISGSRSPHDDGLKLKGRVFIRTILKVERCSTDVGNSILITYKAVGAPRPLAAARIFCDTEAVENEWHQALTRLVELAQAQS